MCGDEFLILYQHGRECCRVHKLQSLAWTRGVEFVLFVLITVTVKKLTLPRGANGQC